MTCPARNISVAIEKSPEEVYDFVSRAENLPVWARGLCWSAVKDGDQFLCDSPMGRIRIQFVPRNPYGVLDHTITLPTGQSICNFMRVTPNQIGAEVIFTLFRQPEMAFQSFMDDVRSVEKDLLRLKAIFEEKRPNSLKSAN